MLCFERIFFDYVRYLILGFPYREVEVVVEEVEKRDKRLRVVRTLDLSWVSSALCWAQAAVVAEG